MKHGAVAMVDALGFKGIWKRTDQDVLAMLCGLSQSTEQFLDKRFNHIHDPANLFDSARVTFLSDTVVFAFVMKGQTHWQSLFQGMNLLKYAGEFPLHYHAVKQVAENVSWFLRRAATTNIPMAYRGAIAFGDFGIEDSGRFIVGPAVDEAAECHEKAQGAVVWLAESAKKKLAEAAGYPDATTTTPHGCLVEYGVPIKGGDNFATYVVSPLAFCPDAADCTDVRDRLLKSFSTPALDVQIKRQNTEKLLDYAFEQWQLLS